MDQVNEAKNIGNASVDQKTDWRALRALDAAVAERVMGWTRHPDAMCRTDNRTIDGVLYCPPGSPGVSLGGYNCVPHYSYEIQSAMEVENRIADLDLRKQYLQALGPIVAKAATEAGEIVGYWHFTHATAEQRCRAALHALECLSISDGTQHGPASEQK